jgi:hypothetical protein
LRTSIAGLYACAISFDYDCSNFKFTFIILLICFRRELVLYLNVFSGDATTEFPSTLQLARGGVRII